MQGPGPAHKQLLESQKWAPVGLTDLVAELMDAVKALRCADYDSATAYDLERAALGLFQARQRLEAEMVKIADARRAIAMLRAAESGNNE